MTIAEIIETFTFYGVDVILLALLTTVLIQLLKLVIPKSAAKKLLTFLPFLIGTVLYAGYFALREGSVRVLLTECAFVMEHGFSVGALSTVVYVVYEQFVRGDRHKTLSAAVCENLLTGYVSGDIGAVAAEIASIVESDVTETALKKVRDKIAENAAEGIDERDIVLLSKAVLEALSYIN